MKYLLLFLNVFAVSISVNSQVVWTGNGDGYSWTDAANWSSGVPTNGSDVIINGNGVTTIININDPIANLGSLQLLNNAYLFLSPNNDVINISGDLTVDEISTISVSIYENNSYSSITVGGNYYFNGNAHLRFGYDVPHIGDEFQIIEGQMGSCGAPTTYLSNNNQGFDVLLGLECGSDAVIYTVLDINYTTAKSWDGEAGDNQWNNAANWDPNGIPTVNDIVYINLPPGGICITPGAGQVQVNSISIGDNNTLRVNGGLEIYSRIHVSSGGSLEWNSGTFSRNNTFPSIRMENYGHVALNTSQVKTLESFLFIFNYGTIDINGGVLNINDGRIFNIDGDINVNGDDITIGYTTSDGFHGITNQAGSIFKKTAGTGTSHVNLEYFVNYGTVISDSGILSFGEPIFAPSYGDLGGSGSFQFPDDYEYDGVISPGNSPGVLNFAGNLNTTASANFNIEINGPNPGDDYDQVLVTNSAVLDGNINVTLGYLPADDASFEVLVAGNLVSCDFPAQITANYDGTNYTFDVVCQNNKLYLNGPGATLSDSEILPEMIGIYPNPVNDELFIKLQTPTTGSWLLYNELGQKVIKGDMNGAMEVKLDMSNLAIGFYILQIKDSNNSTIAVKKVVKQ